MVKHRQSSEQRAFADILRDMRQRHPPSTALIAYVVDVIDGKRELIPYALDTDHKVGSPPTFQLTARRDLPGHFNETDAHALISSNDTLLAICDWLGRPNTPDSQTIQVTVLRDFEPTIRQNVQDTVILGVAETICREWPADEALRLGAQLAAVRRASILRTLVSVQSAVRQKTTLKELSTKICGILLNSTAAQSVSLYMVGKGKSLTRIGYSGTIAPSGDLGENTLESEWFYSGSDNYRHIRIHDLLRFEEERVRQRLPLKRLAADVRDGDANVTWLSAIGHTSGVEDEKAPLLLFRLLRFESEGKPALPFTLNDLVMARVACDYVADILPSILLREGLAKSNSQIKNIRDKTRYRLADSISGSRERDVCELLRTLVPCVASYVVVDGSDLNGRIKTLRLHGDHDETIKEFRWSKNGEAEALILDRDVGVIDATIYTANKHHRGIRLRLNRYPIPSHEYQLIDLAIDELRLAIVGDLDVDDKLIQIAEIRHALRAGLTGILGHLDAGVGLFEDAESFFNVGDEQAALDIAFRRSALRKSMRRARLAGEQVSMLFEDTRMLLADMTPGSLQISDVVIPKILNEIKGLYIDESARRKVDIVILHDQVANHIRAQLDRNLFILAMFNLIDNAVKYSFQGNDVICRVSLHRGDWVISVQNIGRLIPKASHSEIFIPLRRIRPDHGVQEMPGTGLGLAATLRIVELHGGRISVESLSEGPSGGSQRARTTFTIVLPRHRATAYRS